MDGENVTTNPGPSPEGQTKKEKLMSLNYFKNDSGVDDVLGKGICVYCGRKYRLYQDSWGFVDKYCGNIGGECFPYATRKDVVSERMGYDFNYMWE